MIMKVVLKAAVMVRFFRLYSGKHTPVTLSPVKTFGRKNLPPIIVPLSLITVNISIPNLLRLEISLPTVILVEFLLLYTNFP